MQEAKVSTSHLMRQAANLSREFEVVGSAAIDTQTTRPNPQQYGKAAELLLAHRQHCHHGAPPRTPKPGRVSPLLCRGVSSLYCSYTPVPAYWPCLQIGLIRTGEAVLAPLKNHESRESPWRSFYGQPGQA